MRIIRHKINEQLVLLREGTGSVRLRIIRIADGKVFRLGSGRFEDYVPGSPDFYFDFEPFEGTTLFRLEIGNLPKTIQDLLFEYTDDNGVEYDRHIFGGAQTVSSPALCTVYGTLLTPGGQPIPGAKVEAFLNKTGFFKDQGALMGHVATALTDSSGYFELPLVAGANVTINVPITGFVTRGFVPKVPAVELTSRALMLGGE